MIQKSAPRFKGEAVREALLSLITLAEKGHRIPDIHIKLHGENGTLCRLKLIECILDEDSDCIKVIVLTPGQCGEYRTFHFVTKDLLPNPHANLIEKLVIGYPEFQISKVVENTHLGIRTTFVPGKNPKIENITKAA
jgi:hypothetical protein